MTDVSERFNQLVERIDYPMFVVTATHDSDRAGCLVGFATQASIDPPRLLVFVSKANETYRVALHSDVLVVHFLTEDDKELAALFGEESGDWTDKFQRCAWEAGPDGVPVLADVGGWVAGRVIDRIDGGDHVGHLLDPIAVGVGDDVAPLMFQQVRDLDPGHPA